MKLMTLKVLVSQVPPLSETWLLGYLIHELSNDIQFQLQNLICRNFANAIELAL